jgi:hypothetical protein
VNRRQAIEVELNKMLGMKATYEDIIQARVLAAELCDLPEGEELDGVWVG